MPGHFTDKTLLGSYDVSFPGNANQSGFPVVYARKVYDPPYVGTLKKLSTYVFRASSVLAMVTGLLAAPGDPYPPDSTLTLTSRLYLGQQLVSTQSSVIGMPYQTSSAAGQPQYVGSGAVVASQQFNPEVSILPGQSMTWESEYTLGSIPGNSWNMTLRILNPEVQIAFGLETIDEDRSTHGPIY